MNSISPLDGRYYDKVQNLSEYFSDYALNTYRLVYEIEYLIAFYETVISTIDESEKQQLRSIYDNFSENVSIKLNTLL